jgi:hypothetical protein
MKNGASNFGFIKDLRSVIFQGFEWNAKINISKSELLSDFCYSKEQLEILLKPKKKKSKLQRWKEKWANFLKG